MSIAANPPESDLRIGGLCLWIYGRQFEDAQDFWDGNWLNVKARTEASGAYVEARGTFLHLSELKSFAEELTVLIRNVVGTAKLKCLEPNLEVSMRGNHLGHVAVTVSITPDHMTQVHKFDFQIDQTYLKPILASCDEVLNRFPIRDTTAS